MPVLTGTIVNALAILAGGSAGTALGRLRPGDGGLGRRIEEGVGHASALCVIYIGIRGSLEGVDVLVTILSMVIGAVLGEALDLDGKLQALGRWVQRRTAGLSREDGPSVADGFVSASLLFCVGAMGIEGALQDGLAGDHATLYAKAILDGTISVIMGTSLGAGVALSAAPVFLYQGAIALAASSLRPVLGYGSTVQEMGCVGSLLIVAIGTNMLGLTKIRVMDLVPAMFLPIALCRIL